MKIKSLKLKDFTAFEDITFEFGTGINVLVGTNSTGKTHVLKSLYSILKTLHVSNLASKELDEFQLGQEITNKLTKVFNVNWRDLIRIGTSEFADSYGAQIDIAFEDNKIAFFFGDAVSIASSESIFGQLGSAIYLPTHDFLSIYEGFIAAYNQRETSFDETYYDLALALNSRPLKKNYREGFQPLIMLLENSLGGEGKVSEENGRFYITLPEGKFEAQIVSEGLRKIASLLHLVSNGSIRRDGFLFWDEPEANLNPKQVITIVEALKFLTSLGVQSFIATHDFLLSQELSLLSEYSFETPVTFHSLYGDAQTGIKVESGNSLVEIENDPILEEFAAHYDRENRLFKKAVATQ